MNTQIVNLNVAVEMFRAACAERYFGGMETYKRGLAIEAAYNKRRNAWNLVSGLSGLVLMIIVGVLALITHALLIGAIALIVVSFAVTASRALMFRYLDEEMSKLAEPPEKRFQMDSKKWRETPVAATRRVNAVVDELERLFGLALSLSLPVRREIGVTPTDLGRSIAAVARHAHDRVVRIQRQGVTSGGDLDDLKKLLRQCDAAGHHLLGIIWENQKRERAEKHGAANRGPTLIQLAPFSWPGFTGLP